MFIQLIKLRVDLGNFDCKVQYMQQSRWFCTLISLPISSIYVIPYYNLFLLFYYYSTLLSNYMKVKKLKVAMNEQ